MDDKTKVAAISAVLQYIRTEEEAMQMQAMAAQADALPAGPTAVAVNAWGMNGRQSMMQLRNLMQLRAFHGAKLR